MNQVHMKMKIKDIKKGWLGELLCKESLRCAFFTSFCKIRAFCKIRSLRKFRILINLTTSASFTLFVFFTSLHKLYYREYIFIEKLFDLQSRICMSLLRLSTTTLSAKITAAFLPKLLAARHTRA